MKMLVALFLVSAIVFPVFGEIKEEKTGVGFAETISEAGKDLKLSGVGVRSKMMVKVYAAGLYLDSAALQDLAPSRDQISNAGQPLYDTIMNSAGARLFLLHFVRDVDAGKIVEAYEESLKKSIDMNSADVSKDAASFLAASKVDMKKGQQMQIQLVGDEITVVTPSGKSDVIKNKKLAAAVAGIWLGKDPISNDLKKGMISRLSGLLK
jgi:hypothetical protein